VSTFSGCGGSSLGYQLAGGKVLLAVEWDDNAVATYRLNFPDTPIYHGDIGKLSVEACCEKAGVQPGELDILDGSPPCQGFSTAGKRDFGDDRNQLFREYVRLLRGLRPKVFVMENVSGMVKGKMKMIFAECLRELKASGYKVKARLLNAMYFNVPQSRERLIFVGVREDLGAEPGHPKGQSRPITVQEAWRGIVNTADDLRDATPKDTYAVVKAARRLRPGQSCKRKYFNLVRAAWNRPSPTIAKSHGQSLSMAGLMHPTETRRPTIPELKRLGSFPDSYQFIGAFSDRWQRIGNSVPPNFMRAIAEYIRDNILSPVRAT
jgi:DNA (cytosine-5)-methyltransferase 1